MRASLSFSEILRRSLVIFATTFHLVVQVAVGMVVLNAGILAYAPDLFWISAVYAVISGTYLIILFHHCALYPDQPAPPSTAAVVLLFWPFLWRSIALGLGAGFAAGTVLGMMSLFAKAGLAIAALVTPPVIIIIVCLYGTVFPAVVDGGNRAWRAAYKRAEQNLWPIFWMFIKGPFAAAMLMQLAVALLTRTGWSIVIATPEGGVSVLAAIFSFAAAMAQHFITAMAIVILCHVYQTHKAG